MFTRMIYMYLVRYYIVSIEDVKIMEIIALFDYLLSGQLPLYLAQIIVINHQENPVFPSFLPRLGIITLCIVQHVRR